MDAIECLKGRRSIRAFKEDPIEDPIILDILDCARLAPTARNIQPWRFVVIKDENTLKRLKAAIPNGPFIDQAPVCILVLSEETKYYLEDGSAATCAILYAAHARGLGSCWVAGDKKDYCDEVLRIIGAPEGMKLISLVPIGYPKSPGRLHDKKELSTLTHQERF